MSHAESSVHLAENEPSHAPKAAVIDTGISSYSFCIMILRMLWISFSPECLAQLCKSSVEMPQALQLLWFQIFNFCLGFFRDLFLRVFFSFRLFVYASVKAKRLPHECRVPTEGRRGLCICGAGVVVCLMQVLGTELPSSGTTLTVGVISLTSRSLVWETTQKQKSSNTLMSVTQRLQVPAQSGYSCFTYGYASFNLLLGY